MYLKSFSCIAVLAVSLGPSGIAIASEHANRDANAVVTLRLSPGVTRDAGQHPAAAPGSPDEPSVSGFAKPSTRIPPATADQPPVHHLADDPFRYRQPKDGRGFVPSPSTPLPPGIKVLGILILRKGKPLAAIQLPGDGEVHYVHEEDIIEMPVTAGSRQQAGTRGPTSTTGTRPDILYLQIKTITPQHVEICPQDNLGDIHIIR